MSEYKNHFMSSGVWVSAAEASKMVGKYDDYFAQLYRVAKRSGRDLSSYEKVGRKLYVNLTSVVFNDFEPYYSFDEIAKELGISKREVKRIYESGMQKIKSLFATSKQEINL